jgi:hypothetical protein
MPDLFAGYPCTDADVAAKIVGDLAAVSARCERMASGSDGSVAAGSFVLTSAFPFATQGVQDGHVMVLESCAIVPTPPAGKAQARPLGDALAVAAAADGACTLKRLAHPGGLGAFPGNAGPAEALSGVRFFVPTFVPQIAVAAGWVRGQLGLAAADPLKDPDDLRRATVLKAARDLYFAEYRQADRDEFRQKYLDLDAEIKAELASLVASYGGQQAPARVVAVGPMGSDPCWRVPGDGRPRWGWW